MARKPTLPTPFLRELEAVAGAAGRAAGLPEPMQVAHEAGEYRFSWSALRGEWIRRVDLAASPAADGYLVDVRALAWNIAGRGGRWARTYLSRPMREGADPAELAPLLEETFGRALADSATRERALRDEAAR